MPHYVDLTLIQNSKVVERDSGTLYLEGDLLLSTATEPFKIIIERLSDFITKAARAPNQEISYDIYVPVDMDINELKEQLFLRGLPENLKCSLVYFNERAHRVEQRYPINPSVVSYPGSYPLPQDNLDYLEWSPPQNYLPLYLDYSELSPPPYDYYYPLISPLVISYPQNFDYPELSPPPSYDNHDPLIRKSVPIEKMTIAQCLESEEVFNLLFDLFVKEFQVVAKEVANKGKILVYKISGDNLPGPMEKLGIKLRTTNRSSIPDNLRVELIGPYGKEKCLASKKRLKYTRQSYRPMGVIDDYETYEINVAGLLENLLVRLQNSNRHSMFYVLLTLSEQIEALQFGENVPKELADSLVQWKESLAKSLEEAGEDEDKQQALQSHVTKTQAVIRAYQQWNKADPLSDELQKSIEAFTQEILTLSKHDKALTIAAMVFLLMISVGIAAALFIGSGPLVLLLIPLIVAVVAAGLCIVPEVIRDKFAIDVVDNPEPINPKPSELTFGFSDKMKELGFFGNTSKHKAYNFIGAVKEQQLPLLPLPCVPDDNMVLSLSPVYRPYGSV